MHRKITKTDTVSIIFPTRILHQKLFLCLKSIHRLNYAKTNIEVLVIDNTIEGNLHTKLRHFPFVRLIASHHPISFSESINLGIKNAKGKYFLITNDDVIFAPDTLSIWVKTAKSLKNNCILGGSIYSFAQKDNFLGNGYMLNPWTGHVYCNKNVDNVCPDWIQGCGLFVPHNTLKQIGLFDAGYGHFFEDADFCFRAKRQGILVRAVAEAILFHDESTTANQNLPQKYHAWYRSKFRFVIKNVPLINLGIILLVHLFVIFPYRCLFFRDGRLLPLLRGALWNIIHLRQTLHLSHRSII